MSCRQTLRSQCRPSLLNFLQPAVSMQCSVTSISPCSSSTRNPLPPPATLICCRRLQPPDSLPPSSAACDCRLNSLTLPPCSPAAPAPRKRKAPRPASEDTLDTEDEDTESDTGSQEEGGGGGKGLAQAPAVEMQGGLTEGQSCHGQAWGKKRRQQPADSGAAAAPPPQAPSQSQSLSQVRSGTCIFAGKIRLRSHVLKAAQQK